MEKCNIQWKKYLENTKGHLEKKQDISLHYQISLRSFDKASRKKNDFIVEKGLKKNKA